MSHCKQPSPSPLKADHAGVLHIGGIELPCYVLSDGRRVLSQTRLIDALGMSRGGSSEGGGDRLAKFVAQERIKPFVSGGLVAVTKSPIRFFPLRGPEVYGYEATVLADICGAVVAAHADGRLQQQQTHIARQAAVLLGAFAKTGIIALVDEATGFQAFRRRDALQNKLNAFLAEELGEWSKVFPDEIWDQFARLEGLTETPKVRPIRWGKYIMAFVYDAMDKDVGSKLREVNPEPRFRRNHHQWLAGFGRDTLVRHLWQVIGVMKSCRDMRDFRRKFAHVFRRVPLQTDWTEECTRIVAVESVR